MQPHTCMLLLATRQLPDCLTDWLSRARSHVGAQADLATDPPAGLGAWQAHHPRASTAHEPKRTTRSQGVAVPWVQCGACGRQTQKRTHTAAVCVCVVCCGVCVCVCVCLWVVCVGVCVRMCVCVCVCVRAWRCAAGPPPAFRWVGTQSPHSQCQSAPTQHACSSCTCTNAGGRARAHTRTRTHQNSSTSPLRGLMLMPCRPAHSL